MLRTCEVFLGHFSLLHLWEDHSNKLLLPKGNFGVSKKDDKEFKLDVNVNDILNVEYKMRNRLSDL